MVAASSPPPPSLSLFPFPTLSQFPLCCQKKNMASIHQPLFFRAGSPLRAYLQRKRPEDNFGIGQPTTLKKILDSLKPIIKEERLYDARNASILLGDLEFEVAMGMKALHLCELRDQVMKQMVPFPTTPVLPPNTKFHVKEDFLAVLHCVPEVSKEKRVFTYKELLRHLSTYLLNNKEGLFDLRNVKICHCENDPLGTAFGVKAFHRSQVLPLLRTQLLPFPQVLPQPPVEEQQQQQQQQQPYQGPFRLRDNKRKRFIPKKIDPKSRLFHL